MKRFYIHDECWDAELHVIHPATDYDIHRFVKQHFNIKLDEQPDPPGSFTARFVEITGDDGSELAGLIALKRRWSGSALDISTLTHELLHAVSWFLRNRGVKFSEKTEEPYCYLLDSLLRRCLEKF